MAFRATPTNVTEVLIMALAILSIIFLMRKRYDSNVPLLFFTVATSFLSSTDRMMDPILFYGSMATAMVVRFEFLNKSFGKFFAFLAILGLVVVLYMMLTDVTA